MILVHDWEIKAHKQTLSLPERHESDSGGFDDVIRATSLQASSKKTVVVHQANVSTGDG